MLRYAIDFVAQQNNFLLFDIDRRHFLTRLFQLFIAQSLHRIGDLDGQQAVLLSL
jgi:hypothetical protein